MQYDSKNSLVSQLQKQLSSGQIGRRQFLRMATMFGVSLAAARALAGFAGPASAEESTLPFGPDDPNAVKGGTLRIGMRVAKMDDPALYS